PYRKIHGLFIGVSDYANIGDLKTAADDAIVLAETMRDRIGLENPIVLTNESATVENLQRALNSIGERAEPGDLFVFHFSGHGIGLIENYNNEAKGFMLMHDAVYNQSTLNSGTRTGMVDMWIIDKMMDDAGI